MQFSVIVQRAIELANQITDPATRQASERQLRAFLMPLKAAEVYILTTIMYLGRGDFGIAGLMDSYQHTSDTFDNPGRAIEQMLEKTSLHKYLQAGVKALTDAGIDLDTLLTTHADSPLAMLNSSEDVELHVGPWYCDTCGQVIDQSKNGMLQWLSRSEGYRNIGRDLRIVHHRPASPLGGRYGCYPNESDELRKDGATLSDIHLDDVCGWDGLVSLLAMVEDGEFPASVVNRIIMRLYVPGYEQAKRYFQKAIDSGLVQPGLPNGYFLQSQLRDIVANIPRLED